MDFYTSRIPKIEVLIRQILDSGEESKLITEGYRDEPWLSGVSCRPRDQCLVTIRCDDEEGRHAGWGGLPYTQAKRIPTRLRVRSAPPTRPKPPSISAQLAGSGTLG